MEHAQPAPICQSDVMDPARAQALCATLGMDMDITDGTPLPPFFHQIYFWDARVPTRLGRDGHPRVGDGIIPDMGLPRRMWAGGQLEFVAPLHAGHAATKTTTLIRAERKDGRSGPLAFVTLRHDVEQDGKLRVREYQDLVYRTDPNPSAPRPIAPLAATDETLREERSFSTTELFRYSALTFNGHRIHYDEDYSRSVEGYDGLVVHGPLLAQLLMLFAARERGLLNTFAFRATSPLMHHETATLCMKDAVMWVRGPDGRQCMQATVS